jgi:hypothetical protein
VPIERLVATGDWEGTAGDLLTKLAGLAGDDVARDREWPKNASALAAELKRLAPMLRGAGIEWKRLDRTPNRRGHSLRRIGDTGVTTVTTVTRNGTGHDTSGLRAADDRHAGAATVMGSSARNDGHDSRDGTAADRTRDLTRQQQHDLIAAAFDVFGDEIEWFPGLA